MNPSARKPSELADVKLSVQFPKQVRPNGEPRLSFLFVLAVITTISPFATDMYLPAFPQLAADLRSEASGVQLTLTAFLLGMAIGQLVFGPLSDRFGRKGPLITGTLLCLAASAVAAMAPALEVLVAARLVQGFAGASGVVIGRSIVADLFRGPEAARAYSLLAVVGGLAPILAPLVGGILAEPIGWRGVLWALCVLAAAMFVVAMFFIPETRPPRMAPSTPAPGGFALLRSHSFASYMLLKLFAFMVLMGYISASPFIFQNVMGLSPLASGLLFGLNSLALILANSINAPLVRTRGTKRMLALGLWIMAGASLAFALLILVSAPVALYPLPLFFLIGSLGFINGNAIARAMDHARHAAGTGSAYIGCAQFLGGAAVAPLVGLAGETSAGPLAAVLVTASCAALVCFASATRRCVAGA
ncbi:MAG: multidrug effflux MFS transporter [Arthrobacter sp.]